jgi:hypothetical protein
VTYLFAIVLVILLLWFIWRIFRVASPAAAEPPDPVGVREPVPRRPLNRSGAVALEEPGPQDDTDAKAG